MDIIIKIKDSAKLSRIEDLDGALHSIMNGILPVADRPYNDVIEGITKEW